MRIDRCICADVTFAEALKAVREQGLSLRQLADTRGCGATCGMCRPYLRRAMRTGQVVFHQIVTERDEPVADGQESEPQRA